MHDAALSPILHAHLAPASLALREPPLQKLQIVEKLLRQALPKTPLIDLKRRKVYDAPEKKLAKELITKVLKLKTSQNEAIFNLVTIQVEWLKRLLSELREEMKGSVIETVACPIGDLSETVIINSVLDQILTELVINDLRARMRDQEFEIVVSHLLRELPELQEWINHK